MPRIQNIGKARQKKSKVRLVRSRSAKRRRLGGSIQGRKPRSRRHPQSKSNGESSYTDSDSEYSVDLDVIEFMCNRVTVDLKNLQILPKPFDLYDYLSANGLDADALTSPYNSIWQTFDVPFTENRIQVSKSIRMTRTGCITLQWTGNIIVTNRTALNILYMIYSKPQCYFEPELNWIEPRGWRNFTVKVSDLDIKDFLEHGQVSVEAKPIYHKYLLSRQEIYESCWDMDWFISELPFFSLANYSIECHHINDISLKSISMPNWSILDVLYAGKRFFIGRRKNTINFRVPHSLEYPVEQEVVQYIKDYETERANFRFLKKPPESEQPFKFNCGYLLISASILLSLGINMHYYFMKESGDICQILSSLAFNSSKSNADLSEL